MSQLPHRLDRTVIIQAPRENVFRFLTDTPRWAVWWGAGSTIDARPGGAVYIRLPGGVEVRGEVIEVAPPERMVFTYGYATGAPIPVGASRVTLRLSAHDLGTELHLAHEFADKGARDEHIQGWRYQLSLFSNVVTDELNAESAAIVDAWCDLWAEPDEKTRERMLERVGSKDIRFHDRFGNTSGADDLLPHIAAAQRFMPGFRMQRSGDVRHCQGTLLANWVAVGPDGQQQGSGTNVFQLDANGKIRVVTGFWDRR